MSDETHQYVYCLCAAEDNHYAEMAAVSTYLLRRVEPSAQIVVLVDEDTDRQPPAALKLLRDGIDRYEVFEARSDDRIARSRTLKVNMRQRIDGDFMFLDTDTLPIRPLDGAWAVDGDICGVPDPNGYSGTLDEHTADFKALGWGDKLPEIYLNSGVLIFRATPKGLAVGRLWEESYQQYRAYGRRRDQLPFAHAIEAAGAKVGLLPARYNAMIHAERNEKVGRGAAIIHTRTGIGPTAFENVDATVLHVAAKTLKRTRAHDTALLNRFLADGNPWIEAKTFRQHLAMGHYGRALRRGARKLLERASVLPRTP